MRVTRLQAASSKPAGAETAQPCAASSGRLVRACRFAGLHACIVCVTATPPGKKGRPTHVGHCSCCNVDNAASRKPTCKYKIYRSKGIAGQWCTSSLSCLLAVSEALLTDWSATSLSAASRCTKHTCQLVLSMLKARLASKPSSFHPCSPQVSNLKTLKELPHLSARAVVTCVCHSYKSDRVRQSLLPASLTLPQTISRRHLSALDSSLARHIFAAVGFLCRCRSLPFHSSQGSPLPDLTCVNPCVRFGCIITSIDIGVP